MELTLEVLARAVFVRFFFLVHAVFCTWRVVVAEDELNRWTLLLIPLLLIPECVLTLKYSKKGEWQTFSPCTSIYLVSVVPSIWVLEFDLLQNRLSEEIVDGMNITACTLGDDGIGDRAGQLLNITIGDIRIALPELGSETWSEVLQQALLFILIVGRWMLPRGNTGHQQLSNLLLLQIGMAADILEFLSEGVRTDEVLCLQSVIILALALWSASLLQLPFHWDTKIIHRISLSAKAHSDKPLLKRCSNSEVWDIALAVFLQDFPFLCMRLYFVLFLDIFSQGLIFFIAKNVLVLFLQFYRLWALLCLEADVHGRVSNKWANKIRATLRRSRNRNKSQDQEQSQTKDLDNRDKFQVVEERNKSVMDLNDNRDHRGDGNSSHDITTHEHSDDANSSHESTTHDHHGDNSGSHESTAREDDPQFMEHNTIEDSTRVNTAFEQSAGERTPPSKGVDTFEIEENNTHDVDYNAHRDHRMSDNSSAPPRFPV